MVQHQDREAVDRGQVAAVLDRPDLGVDPRSDHAVDAREGGGLAEPPGEPVHQAAAARALVRRHPIELRPQRLGHCSGNF